MNSMFFIPDNENLRVVMGGCISHYSQLSLNLGRRLIPLQTCFAVGWLVEEEAIIAIRSCMRKL